MNSLLRFTMLGKMFVAVACFPALAQDSLQLPATDIYLLDIYTDKKGRLQFENPALITKNENYDNEPWFYPDGSAILYAAVYDSSAGDSSKADVYKYDMRTQKTSVVINTPLTAEFSPMLTPNKTAISVVRVLQDNSSQVLAKCSDKEDNCETILPKIKNIGYYMWIDGSRVVLYLVGDPAILVVANLTTGKIDTIAEDVGRCIQKVPGKNLQVAFVDKGSNPWTIKVYDGKGGRISGVVPTLEDEEDFCYMPDGSLLMGSGSGLFHYVPPVSTSTATSSRGAPASKNASTTSKNSSAGSKNESNSKNAPAKPEKLKEEKSKKNDTGPWEQVAEFKDTPVYQFYRLAVSPKGDKLALVTYFDEKP